MCRQIVDSRPLTCGYMRTTTAATLVGAATAPRTGAWTGRLVVVAGA